MSLKDKLLNTKDITRRTFLKGASAAGASAALYGCGGSSDPKSYIEEAEENELKAPEITGKIIAGATPHNCGGRCLSRYYVEDGVVKRIVTDERGDVSLADGDNPEYRSCVRCHSRKEWFYRNDRLLYPLKQTRERGDISGFQRISWEQAFSEIAAKMKEVIAQYGSEAIHPLLSSGEATLWAYFSTWRLLNITGGHTDHYASYSYPSLTHVSAFIEDKNTQIPPGNAVQDALRSDHIVLWAANPFEMIQSTNMGWYMTQVKETGIPVTAVDTRFSKTASVMADDFINILPSTDAALLLAMMYHLLKNHLDDLDIDFITDHVYGFFDTGNSFVSSHAYNAAYDVPAGGSLSAFVMGDDRSLVDAGLNNGTSVYPNTIGYNVNPDDDLYGKTVSTYGQLPKTPEWAEKITGIPADKIRELAELYLNNKVNSFVFGGYQRHSEQEQGVWLNRIFSAITQNFGSEGQGFGLPMSNTANAAPNQGLLDIPNPVVQTYLYNEDRITDLTYVPMAQRYRIPCFIITDAIDRAGTGTSQWNDGQVKRIHEGFGKIVFCTGGNMVSNQSGDVAYLQSVFKDKSKCEMIVNLDIFMTSSALLSDYVLPSAMQGEKPGAFASTEAVIRGNVVNTPSGEVMDEYSIMAGIADKLGVKEEFLGGFAEGQEGMEARLRAGWDAADLSSKYNMSYDEWVETGIATLHGKYDSSSYYISYKAFKEDPESNPLNTASGKFEAYCANMMEDYEARHHDNIDTVTSDSGPYAATLYPSDPGDSSTIGSIYSAYASAEGNMTARRFVYPIPMYIPNAEGMHSVDMSAPSDELAHDDPFGFREKDYVFTLQGWHMMYRSHSTLNNVAYLDECYKGDGNGYPAYINPDRDYTEGVWDDGVYEPVWINPDDAAEFGISNGDRVLISNDRGRIYASAVVTNRIAPKVIGMGQGGWPKTNSEGIDVGGCTNTLFSARPSRICKGMTLGNECRVKIEKA